jgi:hypothetical protein
LPIENPFASTFLCPSAIASGQRRKHFPAQSFQHGFATHGHCISPGIQLFRKRQLSLKKKPLVADEDNKQFSNTMATRG